MNFVSVRLITADIKRLTRFYEQITGIPVTMFSEDFGELKTAACTLAIGSTRTLQLFGGGDVARPADNHTAIIEFRVDDVDTGLPKAAGHNWRLPGSGADNNAVGQSLAVVPRSGRQPRQFLYAGQRGGDQEVRQVTPRAGWLQLKLSVTCQGLSRDVGFQDQPGQA